MTEFMFSTHSASTSPSNTMYRASFWSDLSGSFKSRNILDSKPSFQSRVTGFSTPYSSDTCSAFGFNENSFVVTRKAFV